MNVLNTIGKCIACVLFFLFVCWFLIMAGSSYKKEQADEARANSTILKNMIETCVIRKDMAAWLESKPVPDQYRIDCEAEILKANPFMFQATNWERFKARIAYMFE